MAIDSTYPLTLPAPSKVGWQVKDRARSSGLPGKALYAAAERDFSGTVEVEFFLNAAQAAEWYAWWAADLNEGGYWFNASWPKLSAGLGVYRIKEPPAFSHLYNGAYTVTCAVQVRGRSKTVYIPEDDIYYNPVAGDANIADVVLLCHGDGQNAGTSILDSSTRNRTMTAVSGVQTSTSQKVFGSASILLNGTTSYASTPASTDFDFASADLTVEAWVYLLGDSPADTGGLRNAAVVSTDTRTTGWALQVNGSASATGTGFALETRLAGVAATVSTDPLGVPQGVWTHLAATKQGTTVRLFLNGELVKTGTIAQQVNSGANALLVGANTANSTYFRPFNGYIEELRVTKGVARYTASFALAVKAFPGVTPGRTVLLLHGEAMVDSSSIPKTLTPVGSAAVSSAQKKYDGGSLFFNGSSQYITISPLADMHLGSNEYIIEGWIYPTAVGTVGRHMVSMSEANTGGFAYLSLFITGTTQVLQVTLQAATFGAAVFARTTQTIPLNTWTHVALIRTNVNVVLYINGVAAGGSSNWVDYPLAKLLFAGIGAVPNGYTDATSGRFQGYMDELRITRGAHRYLQSFTPPAAQGGDSLADDPHFASVVLLTHFNGPNASQSIVDSSAYNRAFIIGGTVPTAVRISTADRKFGGSSLAMDNQTFGAWSLSWAQSSDFDLNTGDFTIEMWAKEKSGVGSLQSLICRRLGGSATGWAFTTNSLRAKINGTWSDGAMLWPVPTQDVWHHYALVRSGSTLTAFVDGKVVATRGEVSTIDDLAGIRVYIGQGDNASENKFYGYIDDLRWTKGVARYRGSFPLPTKPYPTS